MKKVYYFVCLLLISATIVFPTENKESKRKLDFGVCVGGFPFYSGHNSFIISGDIGFQFSKRIGMKADISYTQYTHSYESKIKGGIDQSGESSYSTLPVSLSFLFKSVINDIVRADIGIGVGYYPIKIKEEYTRYTPQSGTVKESDVFKTNRMAPHFLVGLESWISCRIAVFGEMRHVLGKACLERSEDDYYFKDTFFFGGTYILIGIRFCP